MCKFNYVFDSNKNMKKFWCNVSRYPVNRGTLTCLEMKNQRVTAHRLPLCIQNLIFTRAELTNQKKLFLVLWINLWYNNVYYQKYFFPKFSWQTNTLSLNTLTVWWIKSPADQSFAAWSITSSIWISTIISWKSEFVFI